MTESVYPVLPGLSWVGKSPEFKTLVQESASGVETTVSQWAAPKWHFRLRYEVLDDTATQFKTLLAFFAARRGRHEPFLFEDPDDNQVAGQQIGVGDGVTKVFQLVRSIQGTAVSFTEPVRRLKGAPKIYLGGALQENGWTVSPAAVVTFTVPPAAGVAITADLSFYFRVRFAADQADFEQFAHNLWELGELELVTAK